ncbi:MAG: alpha-galactosidase [Clostridiales bacterium]|nr:alpha-galactosidase [Clostridiales bacterium]
MPIIYDEAHRAFKLDTPHTSYVIAITDDEGFLGHAYYGASVSDTDLSHLLRIDEPPFVPSKNDRERGSFLDSFPSEYPGNGVGDYREGAVSVRDADGHTAVSPLYVGYRIEKGKPDLPGLPATFGSGDECETLLIFADDRSLDLHFTLRYTVFSDLDVIARSVIAENHSDKPIYLTKIMSASIDMDDRDYKMRTLHGSWARERVPGLADISYGKQGVGSVRGESSHQANPFIALESANATETEGEIYAFHLVYSGNFIAQVEKSQFDSLRVMVGINPQEFCWKLEPGETFDAPELVMTYSNEGRGKMTRTLHDLYRGHLIRSPHRSQKRPILINNWEATYFDFDTEKLLQIARVAKECGIEMLVMDDGWFGHRSSDDSSLGDWVVNENKLPGGLKYLVDEVNKIGLKFGIWFEPEMVSPDSDLYRAHPDWAIAIPGREACLSRCQLVLDLTRQEVRDYAYESLAAILRSANISYLKWDMNRQLSDLGSAALPADRQGEISHRYMLAVYEMQERLVHDFPDLLFENCSGGGARFDPGMLYYSPQIWCSDDTDAAERLIIQEGTEMCYPLSSMGAHVSICPNHAVGRVTPFGTRANVALAGTFGYELDITKLSDEEKSQVREQVKLYHKYNDLVREGDYYRVASYAENRLWDCWEVVSKDKSEALVTYVQVLGRPNVHSRNLRLLGLDGSRRYRVYIQNDDSCQAEEAEEIYRGDTLMHAGIQMPPLWGDFRSALIHLTAADQ